jgi:branched-subunit amino acid transport protein
MSYSTAETWIIILALGLGTFLIRFSFLGLIGARQMSPATLRLLRYTAVGVIPGLVAPLALWPAATGGQPDPARLIAAATALAVGLVFRNVLGSIFAGAAALYATQYLLA